MKSKELFRRAITLLTACAISISLSVYSGTAVISADSEQTRLENELKDIKKKQDEVNKAIRDTSGDISREQENQEKIDEQIKTTEEYIRTLTELIKEYNSQIEGLELDVAARQAEIFEAEALIEQERQEIEDSIQIYEKQLRAMYISGEDSYAAILLGANDFFDMLMKMELVKRVAGSNNEFIEHLMSLKNSYEQNKADLEDKVTGLENAIAEVDGKKTEVEALKADWNAQLDDLNELRSQSKSVISELEKQRKAYEANKDELEKEADEIEEEIQELIRKAARSEYIGDLEPGTFLWPLPGYPTITSPYEERWGTMHYGIDIAGANVKGAEITAANSGVVIKVNNSCTHNYYKEKSCGCGGGFGNYCIIDHGGGYTTLYAHASEITVKEGQHVTTGDVIGTVGSTGYAMGYHLHFEVRVNGERKDPESFNLLPY